MRLTRKRLKYLFTVDLTTGLLFWRRPSKHHPDLFGTEAGCNAVCDGKLYRRIMVDGRIYYRSHLIFFLVRGRMPRRLIDHENRNSLDDRPRNLREASPLQNTWNRAEQRNRRSGLPEGVKKVGSKFAARINCRRKEHNLGCFDSPALAYAAYIAKKKELFGAFAPTR